MTYALRLRSSEGHIVPIEELRHSPALPRRLDEGRDRAGTRSGRDRATAIGAGYSHAAISTLLETVADASTPVSPALVARIGDWLTAYAHHQDEPRLREMLATIARVS